MFCNDLREKYEEKIILKGVDAETMNILLDYTYTSKMLITKQNVQKVLEAASLFQVQIAQTHGSSGSSSLLYPGYSTAYFDFMGSRGTWLCLYLRCSKNWPWQPWAGMLLHSVLYQQANSKALSPRAPAGLQALGGM